MSTAHLLASLAICFALTTPAAAAQGNGNPGANRLRPEVLKRFDQNGNGRLDPAERATLMAAVAKRRSAGNGTAGTPPRTPDPERRAKVLARFDTDGDGKLNETERAAAKAAAEKLRGN